MHREIINVEEGKVVDHINHNGLDNRKVNLRPATIAQNGWNRKPKTKNCSSKYKGVWWDKQLKKYRAQIWFNGNRLHLGYFKNQIDAAKAYDKAAKKYHGQFASPNFK